MKHLAPSNLNSSLNLNCNSFETSFVIRICCGSAGLIRMVGLISVDPIQLPTESSTMSSNDLLWQNLNLLINNVGCKFNCIELNLNQFEWVIQLFI